MRIHEEDALPEDLAARAQKTVDEIDRQLQEKLEPPPQPFELGNYEEIHRAGGGEGATGG